MRLLALDQASITSGWSIFENGEYITHGKFTFRDENIGDRLYKIRNKVKELIVENEIDEVILEDIQLQNNVTNNVQTFKVLAEVFGVVEELLIELNIPYSAVLASSWKSTLKIKGRTRVEQKRNAQQYVINTYNIKATQDESDAICIGTHYYNRKPPTPDHDWSD